MKALGCEGLSKSQVSRICRGLDDVVEKFLSRPLDGRPYWNLWLDTLSQKVREEGRIVSVSVVVATAVNAEGRHDIVGMDVGTGEDGVFWLSFLRSLVARGGLRDALATQPDLALVLEFVTFATDVNDVAVMQQPVEWGPITHSLRSQC